MSSATAMILLGIICLLAPLADAQLKSDRPPNILWIFADDMGYNDLGLKNPIVKTPNLDKLARGGIMFTNNYVQNLCSPSRSSLMTARYPYKIGMQHEVLLDMFPRCVGLEYKFLSEYFKELNYTTHAIGKWHLGYCRDECTPLYRGFDTFFGYYSATATYYSHKGAFGDFDFYKNGEVYYKANGTHAEPLYVEETQNILESRDPNKPFFLYLNYQNPHSPLEPQPENLAHYEHLNAVPDRKNYLGLVTGMDNMVGDVMSTLEDTGLINNTIVIFMSDNGGDVLEADNSPFRGGKSSLWEGGTRGLAFMYSPLLKHKAGTTVDAWMHVVDWNPTLISIAGGTPPTPEKNGIDGMDMKKVIFEGAPSPRKDMVYNIDREFNAGIMQYGETAVRIGKYKLIWGMPGQLDGYGTNVSLIPDRDYYKNFVEQHENRPRRVKRGGPYAFDANETKILNNFMDIVKVTEQRLEAGTGYMRLFNLEKDPYETTDLSQSRNPKHIKALQKLVAFVQREVATTYKPMTPESLIGDKNYAPDKVLRPGFCKKTYPLPPNYPKKI